MTVSFEAGYALPSGDMPLKNARILHKGVMFEPKTTSATAENPLYPASGANIGDTVDRWRPFENGIIDPMNLLGASWTRPGITVGGDNQTLSETATTGEHSILQAYTFTAVQHVVAYKVQRQTIPEVQIRVSDGTTAFTCFFDLRTGVVGTAANCVGQIKKLTGQEYMVSIYFTPLAATGVVYLRGSNGSEAISYAGSISNTIKVKSAYAHASSASIRYDLFSAEEGDMFAIAAHNLGSGIARITLEHDSDANDTWTALGVVTPTDNSPILFFFVPVTSARWRITVDRGVMPEIGVWRIGKALQMTQPFYAGHTPSRMDRNVQILGNLSGSGELLGRSIKRSTLNASYPFSHLKYDWVRANLDGPNGLIQNAEIEPMFVAWRPGETQDVAYLMEAQTSPPEPMGMRDFWTFSLRGSAYSYE
jgi:hypothetical protein